MAHNPNPTKEGNDEQGQSSTEARRQSSEGGSVMAARADLQSISSELEQIGGHLRGIAYQLRELGAPGCADVKHLTDEERDESERRAWLWEVLVDAIEREQARLEPLAARLYSVERARTSAAFTVVGKDGA